MCLRGLLFFSPRFVLNTQAALVPSSIHFSAALIPLSVSFQCMRVALSPGVFCFQLEANLYVKERERSGDRKQSALVIAVKCRRGIKSTAVKAIIVVLMQKTVKKNPFVQVSVCVM